MLNTLDAGCSGRGLELFQPPRQLVSVLSQVVSTPCGRRFLLRHVDQTQPGPMVEGKVQRLGKSTCRNVGSVGCQKYVFHQVGHLSPVEDGGIITEAPGTHNEFVEPMTVRARKENSLLQQGRKRITMVDCICKE